MTTEVDASMTPWYHGNASKDVTSELLLADNGANDTGKFLYRDSVKAEYVLSVIFKGKVTHHQVVLKKGKLALNGKVTPASTLTELTDFLREPQGKAWPLGLTTGVPGMPLVGTAAKKEAIEEQKTLAAKRKSEAIAAEAEREEAAARQAAQQKADAAAAATEALSAAHRSDVFVDPSMTPYYHGDISDEDARELLSVSRHGGAASGNFLYGKSETGYNLWVLHEGDVKRHRIVIQEKTGMLLYNGRASGTQNLVDLTTFLSSTRQVVTDGGVDLEERQKASEFDLKVQESRSKQAEEDTAKFAARAAAAAEVTVAGWTVKLTTGVLGHRTKSAEEYEAEQLAIEEAEAAAKLVEEERERQERKAHQEAIKESQKEKIQAELEELQNSEQAVLEELNSEELKMTRKASVKKIAEQKRQNEIKKKEEEARQAQVAKLNKLTVAANTKEVVADSDSSDSEDEGVKEKWVRRGSKEAKTVPAFDFIHNPMSEKEAHAWLCHGVIEDGKFIVRMASNGSTNYFIDVINYGIPRTYSVVKPKPKKGQQFTAYTVDKNPTEQTSIEMVVKFLRLEHQWWDVPLTTPVEPIADPKEAKAEIKRIMKEQKQSMKRK